MKNKSGKVKTTNEQNIQLQKLFLANGYKFLNGRTEPHIRDNLDFFYFNKFKIIYLDSEYSIHTNRNPFNLRMWDGEIHFKKQKVKEYDANELIELISCGK